VDEDRIEELAAAELARISAMKIQARLTPETAPRKPDQPMYTCATPLSGSTTVSWANR